MKSIPIVLVCLAFLGGRGEAAEQPNIVFFFADDQTSSSLGCYGHPFVETPNLDALAARGVRFENAFVSQSVCWVSRTSILTGLTGRAYGAPEDPEQTRADAARTLKVRANADTPNYQARDIDFRSALAAASGQKDGGVHLATTSARHIPTTGVNGTGAAELKYRAPLAPALDGNTVDPQLEQAAFAENSVRYQATLTFLSTKFRGLMTAITGQ